MRTQDPVAVYGETMKKRRRIAIAAVLACMLWAPLGSGLPAARADELADLRANQKLLQQRLDQLAPGQLPSAGGDYTGGEPGAGIHPTPGAAKTAGKGTVGGSFPHSFLVPGTDTSVRVGGSISFGITHYFTGGNAHQPASTTNSQP